MHFLGDRSPYAIRPLSMCPVLSVCMWHSCTVAKRLDGSKMKLGMKVGFCLGHIVLDGDQAPLHQRGTAPQHNFRPMSVRPNGCLNQDVTWYRARPRPRRLCWGWGPRYPATPKSFIGLKESFLWGMYRKGLGLLWANNERNRNCKHPLLFALS